MLKAIYNLFYPPKEDAFNWHDYDNSKIYSNDQYSSGPVDNDYFNNSLACSGTFNLPKVYGDYSSGIPIYIKNIDLTQTEINTYDT